ncbi:MAG: outer membrane protein transport protein [Nitrospira sp.]|nr:outer membrane protein transport protein [Nitrospira sp.]
MLRQSSYSRPSLPGPLLALRLRYATLRTILALVTVTGFALPAFGEGFRILDQSAAATAQGGAFAAQADDPSAVHFNPAAITDLHGLQITAGTLLVNGDIDFRPSSGPAIEGDFGGTFANPPPSSFFVTARLGDLGAPSLKSLTLGLGVYSPFGNITRYPRTSGLAPILTRAASPILDVTPTVAFRVHPSLALGAGLDVYTFSDLFGEGHVEVQQTGADLARAGFPFAPDDGIELNGRDTALGYHVGLLLTPVRNEHEQPLVNVALVYRSRATLNLRGQLLNKSRGFALGAKADLNLPQVVTAGLAVWPIRDTRREWKVEVDVDFADWTSFDHLDVTLSNGAVLPNPRNWQTSYVVMAGTEYKFVKPAWLPSWDVAVRGGYVYSDSPVPERTFRPDVPDSNSHSYSAGIGFLCRRGGLFLGVIPCGTGRDGLGVAAIGIDVAYQGIFYQSRGISNNIDPRVHGVWDTTIHVGSLNLRVNFGAPRSF